MFNPQLRNPIPEIASVGKSGLGQGGQRRRSQGRKKERILSSDHRGVFPIKAKRCSAHSYDSEIHAVEGVGKSSRKIELHIAARLRASPLRPRDVQAEHGLSQCSAEITPSLVR